MKNHVRQALLLFTVLVTATTASAGVLPFQDDASLHDVQFVGDRIGWAVGDHGVIWRTTDGGRNWDLIPSAAAALA